MKTQYIPLILVVAAFAMIIAHVIAPKAQTTLGQGSAVVQAIK